jgi:hypothetical protein
MLEDIQALFPMIVLMEDEITHTQDHPCCNDPSCPCHKENTMNTIVCTRREHVIVPVGTRVNTYYAHASNTPEWHDVDADAADPLPPTLVRLFVNVSKGNLLSKAVRAAIEQTLLEKHGSVTFYHVNPQQSGPYAVLILYHLACYTDQRATYVQIDDGNVVQFGMRDL